MEAQYIGIVATAALTGKIITTESYPGESPMMSQRRDMAVGWAALALDDPSQARQRLSQARYVDSSGRIDLWTDAWLARTQVVLGEFQAAQRTVERGLAKAERLGVSMIEPLLLWSGAQISGLRGDKALANSYASRLMVGADTFPIQRIPALIAQLQLADINNDATSAQRAGSALNDLQEEVDFGHPGFWTWEHIWAKHLIYAGRLQEADELLSRAEARNAEIGLDSVSARLGAARASLLIQQGQVDAGVDMFEGIVALIKSLHMPT